MKKILTILLLALTLTGCVYNANTAINSSKTDEEKQAEKEKRPNNFSVQDLAESENLREISFNEVLNEIYGTKVLFLSFDDCPYCYDALPILKGVANTYGIEVVYVKVDREERKDGNETYDALRTLLGNMTSEEKTYIPCVIFVNDGGITYVHEGTVESQIEENGEVPVLTKDQKSELKEIYTLAIETLLDEVSD